MANMITPFNAGQGRFFMQPSLRPSKSPEFYGDVAMGDQTQPLGEQTPQYAPSTEQVNRWDIVGYTEGEPGLATAELSAKLDLYGRDAWLEWAKSRQPVVGYSLVYDKCSRPDSFGEFKSAFILPAMLATEITISALNPMEPGENAQVMSTLPVQARELIRVFTLQFEEQASALVNAEVVSGVIDARGCDVVDLRLRAKRAYFLALAHTGTPGTNPLLTYTTDGETWQNDTIDSLGGNDGDEIALMGDKLVIVSNEDGAHHWVSVNDVNDGISDWSRIASGYVGSGKPNAIYVAKSALAFIAGDGGYIYELTNPTRSPLVILDGSLTTQNFNDIHGYGHVLLAVGASSAMVYSINDGDAFSLVSAPTAGLNIKCVWCLSEDVWMIGTGNGKLYATEKRGKSWFEIVLDGDIASVNDIRFTPDGQVGYVGVTTTGGEGRIYRSVSQGSDWFKNTPAFVNQPDCDSVNVVVPFSHNQVFVGGENGSGDGIIAVAS